MTGRAQAEAELDAVLDGLRERLAGIQLSAGPVVELARRAQPPVHREAEPSIQGLPEPSLQPQAEPDSPPAPVSLSAGAETLPAIPARPAAEPSVERQAEPPVRPPPGWPQVEPRHPPEPSLERAPDWPRGAPPATAGPPAGRDADSPIPEPASEAAQAPSRRKARNAALAAAAAAAVLGAGAAVLWQRQGRPPPHAAYALPFSHPLGLALDPDTGLLRCADRKRLLLYGLDRADGEVRSLRRFTNPVVTGLAWGKGFFWSTDSEEGSIFRHAPDADSTVLRTYANRGRRPAALHWDGSRLWVSDPASETVAEYAPGDGDASLAVVSEHALPGLAPSGLHASEGLLWVLDPAARLVRRYRVKSLLVPEDSLDLAPYLPPSARVTGLAVDDAAVWVAAEAPPELHRLDRKALTWRRERADPWRSRGD